ncbi:MAG: hypothetical protein GWN07_41135, partial [Actinobacteria bacterium]|nr:hypothetical protein [Actinomycetota bacterium]NIS37418.1 hypothetical protein [Actinomycetota bacterium]NIU71845.1 hypothetical protein [Actinomycetota bacterium]NIW33791.1 hypothetical protein [Actinomycetota bacterium]NIX25880.1 hypothetical protein [Actinomycetota bacterium]
RTFHRTRHPEALGAPLWGDDDTPGGPEGTVVGLAWVGHGDPDVVGWAHDYELVVGP